MVKKLLHIILGNWRSLVGYSTDEVKRRRLICQLCESNVKYLGSHICSECGCFIKAKTTIENEKCLKNKW